MSRIGLLGPFAATSTLCVGLLLAPASGASDILEMRTGSRMEGRILEESGDTYRFETLQRIELNIPKSSVVRAERQPAHTFHERLAEVALNADRYAEAITELEKAIAAGGDQKQLQSRIDDLKGELAPRASAQFAARLAIAKETLNSGNLEDAERRLRGILSEIPEDDEGSLGEASQLLAQVLSRQADRQVDAVNFLQAERLLREAAELDPNNYLVTISLAEVLGRNPLKREEAVSLFRRAISDAGEGLSAEERNRVGYSMGRLYRELGDHANAVRFLRVVYQANPQFMPDLPTLLVDSLVSFGRNCEPARRELAVRCAQEALAINTRSIEAGLLLANNLMELRRYEEASNVLKALTEQEPRRRELNQMLAMAYLRQGQVIEARRHLERELQLNAQNYDVLCELGDLDLTAGLLPQARERFERAQTIDDKDPRATLGLAGVEREAENHAQALAHVRRVLDALPDHLAGNLELGYVQRDQHNYEAAAEAFGKVVSILEERRSDDYEWRRQLADALVAQGEVRLLTTGPGTATRDFNRALEVLPDYALAYFSIGEAYKRKFADSKQLEDLRLAEQNMLKAREIEPSNPEFAFGLGVLYQQVLAAADGQNSTEYMQKAVKHYEDYISAGGGQVETVRGWIRESGGEASDSPS